MVLTRTERTIEVSKLKTPVTVNPDEKHILSADGDNAILLGSYAPSEDSMFERCVLIVPRSVYLNALSQWLDGKANYREQCNGEFAGVGYIMFEEAELQKDMWHHLNDFDESSESYHSIDVPTYR